MTTIAELTTPMTTAEATTAIYDALAARGVVTSTWKPGAVVRTIIAGLAIVLAALSSLQALLAKSAFLDYATGAWLTLVARYVYETERSPGAFASGNVTLDNAGGGVYSVAIGDFLCANPATGKTYRNTAAFSIASLQTGVVVPVEAIEIGSASSSAAGTITELTTPLLGVTCTNVTALVGVDEESDPDLRARCRAKWSTIGTGSTAAAYEYWAKAASSEVARVSVRSHDALGITTDGAVTVILATASGAVSAAAVTAVSDYILTKRPLCAALYVASASPIVINVGATLTARNGFGAAAVTQAAANLVALSAVARIGETVYRAAITEQLMLPDGVVNAVITSPTVDIPLAWNEVPTFSTTLAYSEIP